MPVKIELEQREITIILKALQEQPYNRVAAIIHKITNQIANQIANQNVDQTARNEST